MRVLFVSNYAHLPDLTGGLQTTTHDLCLAIKAMGADAAVLCGRLRTDPSAAEQPASVHDLHATILHLLGFDHERLTYRYSGRDFRLTDVHGRVIDGILA